MTVKELTEKMGLKAACMPVPEREISGAYIAVCIIAETVLV